MSKNRLIQEYMSEVRPFQTVDQLIKNYKNKMDIIDIKESDLSKFEEFHFKFLRLNYEHKYNIDPMEVHFQFFLVQKNEKSKPYYDLMENELERIIVVIEQRVNLVMSNSRELSLDLKIERGIEAQYVEKETIELLEYLVSFDLRKQL
ncbi:hypothetical protein [Fusibacter sp. 3D3]|uniref:hypothetical protein n=1 Tax=Fusibacter sp. 3D3 TaxID=1048380 RepID=UPI000853CE80|nr:hypothetical protein [Fusibacter sp. 3D3]GAU77928.1 hypothetical protein F3D3_2557 [Fusibacter sp. 3D3]